VMMGIADSALRFENLLGYQAKPLFSLIHGAP